MPTRMRGTAAGRARDADKRPRSFERGHPKCGGRKRGTPNVFSADYKKAILEAAYRIGSDGNGKDGLLGYFVWLALYHTREFIFLVGLQWQALETELSTEPAPTREECDEWVRHFIAGPSGKLKPKSAFLQEDPAAEQTGQDLLLSLLMHAAIKTPKHFCRLYAAAFLRTPRKRRVSLRSKSRFAD